MDRAAILPLVDMVLGRLERGDAVSPAELQFLVRAYAAGHPGVDAALGPALGAALATCRTPAEGARRAEWVALFVESDACAEDERLAATAGDLADELARGWAVPQGVAAAMRGVDACVAAAAVLPDRARAHRLLARAVDELERTLAGVYTPGEGLGGSLVDPDMPGSFADHVTAAAALLSAYDATGRLPYAMLADETMRFARRAWWDAVAGAFTPAPVRGAPGAEAGTPENEVAAHCLAARVLSRLAAIARDPDYLPDLGVDPLDHAADARRVLESLLPGAAEPGPNAGWFGLALIDLLAAGA